MTLIKAVQKDLQVDGPAWAITTIGLISILAAAYTWHWWAILSAGYIIAAILSFMAVDVNATRRKTDLLHIGLAIPFALFCTVSLSETFPTFALTRVTEYVAWGPVVGLAFAIHLEKETFR